MKQKQRRVLSVVLSVAMLFSMTGMNTVLAAEETPPGEYGLCEHHTKHTADCYTDELICDFIVDGDADIATDSDSSTATDSNAPHRHTQECYRLDCDYQCDICNPPAMLMADPAALAELKDGRLTISSETAQTDNYDSEGWKWDGSTLTLKDVNGTDPDPVKIVEFDGIISSAIKLESDVTLDATGLGNVPVIYQTLDGGTLTIDAGKNTLTVESGADNVDTAILSYGALEITGGSVTASALWAYAEIAITGSANVTATEGGIRGDDGITISTSGKVKAANTNVELPAIRAWETLTISGGADVTAVSSQNSGITAGGKINISGGSTVTVTGASEVVGLGSVLDAVIVDNSTVTVINTGGPAILATFGSEDGKVTAPTLKDAQVARVSTNADGSGPADYAAGNIAAYKYMRIVANSKYLHTITASAGAGGSVTPSGAVAVGDSKNQSFTVTANRRYSIEDVKVDGVSRGKLASYTFDSVTEDHTISAEFSYTGGGGGSGGGGGRGGGGGGAVSSTITVAVAQQASAGQNAASSMSSQTNVSAVTDANRVTNVTVPATNVATVIKAVQDAAGKAGTEKNNISVVIDVKVSQAASAISTTLPAGIVEEIIKAGAPDVKIQSNTVDITLDLAALIAAQAAAGESAAAAAGGDVIVAAVKLDAGTLSAAAQQAIGNRPVFRFTLQGGDKPVTEFGGGTEIFSIPYTPQEGEETGKLCAVYVDDNGGVTWLADSSYDPNTKSMLVKTGHFSAYGVGYRSDAPQFTDTADHWAKDDIDFAAARGFLTGSGGTTFSPDTAMTNGAFVTALSRLAGINPDSYRTGGTAPEQAVTRQELAVIMANYAQASGYALPQTRAEVTFADDGSIADHAKASVKAMQMAGVMNGKTGGSFDPAGAATRAEAAAVLRRYMDLTIDSATAQGWDTNDSGQRMYYKNGSPVTDWKLLGGKWYYFYADGSMAVSTNVGGYEVGPDGARK